MIDGITRPARHAPEWPAGRGLRYCRIDTDMVKVSRALPQPQKKRILSGVPVS
jgi:hypothetical protein